MKSEASKGYVAYALSICGYNDDMKISIIGKFGLLLKDAYPDRLQKYAKRNADITKSAVKTLSRIALKQSGVSESKILEFTFVLEEQMKYHTKKAASLYFIKDKYLTYEPLSLGELEEEEYFDEEIDLEDADEDEFEILD